MQLTKNEKILGVLLIFFVLAAIGLAITVGILDQQSSGEDDSLSVSVGAVIPDNSFGQQMLIALNVSLQQFNFQGVEIKLHISKTDGSADQALEATKSLIARGIHKFIGPFTSDECLLVIPWASEFAPHAIFISPTATMTSLDAYENFIRLDFGNPGRALAILHSLLQIYENSTAPINLLSIAHDDPSARELVGLIDGFQSQAGERVFVWEPIWLPVDFDNLTSAVNVLNQIQALVDPNISTAILMIGRPEDVVLILEAAISSQPSLLLFPWFGSGFVLSEEIFVSPQSTEGALKTTLISPIYIGDLKTTTDVNRQDFLEAISEQAGTSPNLLTTLTHDALLLFTVTERNIVESSNSFYSVLLQQASETYGYSGHLILSNQGSRLTGTYIVAFCTLHLDGTPSWELLISIDVDDTGLFLNSEVTSRDIGAYLISAVEWADCDGSLTVDMINSFSVPEQLTFELPLLSDLSIPVYHDFSLSFECGEYGFHMKCPKTDGQQEISCETSSYNRNSKSMRYITEFQVDCRLDSSRCVINKKPCALDSTLYFCGSYLFNCAGTNYVDNSKTCSQEVRARFPTSTTSPLTAVICQATVSNVRHTWVRHPSVCSTCSKTTRRNEVLSWTNVGFEKRSGLGFLPSAGALRDDASTPCYRVQETTASDQCSRQAVGILFDLGWDNASYSLASGIVRNCESRGCDPWPKLNVCWDFTCAYEFCALARTGCNNRKRSVLPPANWNCDTEHYGSSDGCHCMCGAWDPDCYDESAPTIGCSGSQICIHPGNVCVARNVTAYQRKLLQGSTNTHLVVPYDSISPREAAPSEWRCPLEFYGTNDGCDCECGIWDPDCDLTEGKYALNCPESFMACDRTSALCSDRR